MSASTRKSGQAARPNRAQPPHKRQRRRRVRMSFGMQVALVLGGAVAILALIFFVSNANNGSNGGAGAYAFTVGKPGPGEMAPPIKLASTSGGDFDLAAVPGKTVLLYFQEGLSCQPCWDQLRDIQAQRSQFAALGIDEIVTITSDPLDALQQKAADEQLTLPVLSDPQLAVSEAYTANRYGMMGGSRDGHTFIVVGPDGKIRWRADYGGAPHYTMYVPIPNLLADIRQGLRGASS